MVAPLQLVLSHMLGGGWGEGEGGEEGWGGDWGEEEEEEVCEEGWGELGRGWVVGGVLGGKKRDGVLFCFVLFCFFFFLKFWDHFGKNKKNSKVNNTPFLDSSIFFPWGGEPGIHSTSAKQKNSKKRGFFC